MFLIIIGQAARHIHRAALVHLQAHRRVRSAVAAQWSYDSPSAIPESEASRIERRFEAKGISLNARESERKVTFTVAWYLSAMYVLRGFQLVAPTSRHVLRLSWPIGLGLGAPDGERPAFWETG